MNGPDNERLTTFNVNDFSSVVVLSLIYEKNRFIFSWEIMKKTVLTNF